MILSELVFAFKNDYMLECIKRGVEQIELLDKQVALMLSKVCSDIQKKFGVIQLEVDVTTVIGTSKYLLTADFLSIDNVCLYYNTDNKIDLTLKSDGWMRGQDALSGMPLYYSTRIESAIPFIEFYPVPSEIYTVKVYYKPNFKLYSPSSTTVGDFGNYGLTNQQTLPYPQIEYGGGFTGNTVFPSIYDNLIILGLMKQMFKEYEEDYIKESILLRAKQFNGEKLDYNMPGVI